MPGYEIDRFVDLTQNEKNELICSICQDILRCPVVTSCCGQSFCDDCINDWLNNNNTCPYDRKRLTTDQLSRAPRMVKNLLGKLKIQCDFRDNGCNEVILLENLSNHLQRCQYNNRSKECDKCFSHNIKANHDCVECLLDTNSKITIELNHLKLSNAELKKEKESYGKILETALMLMKLKLNDRNSAVLVSISEVMYLLVKTNEFKSNSSDAIARKNEVITKVLDILHLKCVEMPDNKFLLRTLLMFKIPEDVEFEYNRVVSSVMHILDSDGVDNSTLDMCTHLLLRLTLVKTKRNVIGSEKGVNTLLKHIREKVRQNTGEDIVRWAWSILWNITDENAVVCETFCKSNGLKCFSACCASFSTNLTIIQAMFGVLGNVAECPQLRHLLLDKAYMRIFLHHLDLIEKSGMCSFVGGILSHLLLVDRKTWERKVPKLRGEVQRILNDAIPRWNVKTERSIDYSSFKPFRQILLSEQSPNESKLWVIWEIANLTHVNGSKYCPYLEDNNLLTLIDNIAHNTDCPTNMRSLALTVMQQYYKL